MAPHLPLELISQVAQYRRLDSRTFLAQYALVGRKWQAAFEPYLYASVCVQNEEFETARSVIALERFPSLTSISQHCLARRRMIKELHYRVILPFHLPDYTSVINLDPEVTYTPDNAVRGANNESFQAGMISLFNVLACWSADCRLALRVSTIGREEGNEPGTEDRGSVLYTFEFQWGRWVVRPYRAQFPQVKRAFPFAACVDSLVCDGAIFDCASKPTKLRQILPDAACQIARFCPTLSYFCYETRYRVRPDHLDYTQQRREDFAECILDLPSTLKKFEFSHFPEEVIHQSCPAPVLLSDGVDIFSNNLRTLSFRLENLSLYRVSLAIDFLCPLDQQAYPIEDLKHISWPYLRNIRIQRADFLPTGEWLLARDPDSDYNPDTPTELRDLDDSDPDYGDELELLLGNDEYVYFSWGTLKPELCHLENISLAYAARCMPRLQDITYYLTYQPATVLELKRSPVTRGVTISWAGESGYFPDERVARAWGFELESMSREGDEDGDGVEIQVVMGRWPNTLDTPRALTE